MIIGFTGTQIGMSQIQILKFINCLTRAECSEFHHGDCLGSDAQAHDIAEKLNCKIVIHPPIIAKKRAFKKSKFILPEKHYLDRNKDIVNACELLMATPKGNEELRSGTWATIRYAKEIQTNIMIIFPNGSSTMHSFGSKSKQEEIF